jgi:hypothetical protein
LIWPHNDTPDATTNSGSHTFQNILLTTLLVRIRAIFSSELSYVVISHPDFYQNTNFGSSVLSERYKMALGLENGRVRKSGALWAIWLA